MEGLCRVVRDELELDVESGLGGQRGGIFADLGVHFVDQRVGRVAQVDREFHRAGDDVAAVRMHLHHADCAAPMRLVAVRQRDNFLHQARRNLQRDRKSVV